jgi:hypothetical protein
MIANERLRLTIRPGIFLWYTVYNFKCMQDKG